MLLNSTFLRCLLIICIYLRNFKNFYKIWVKGIKYSTFYFISPFVIVTRYKSSFFCLFLKSIKNYKIWVKGIEFCTFYFIFPFVIVTINNSSFSFSVVYFWNQLKITCSNAVNGVIHKNEHQKKKKLARPYWLWNCNAELLHWIRQPRVDNKHLILLHTILFSLTYFGQSGSIYDIRFKLFEYFRISFRHST